MRVTHLWFELMMVDDQLLCLAEKAALAGGAAILSAGSDRAGVSFKRDGSPVTRCDRASHDAIVTRLSCLDIPIVSEEAANLHLDAERYWLVDPLDGTKEFVAGIPEYTVNIALIENGFPILGVVNVPATDEIYYAVRGRVSWRRRFGVVSAPPRHRKVERPRVVVSRFHDHPHVATFAKANRAGATIALGSALKYCRLAWANADVAPRLVGCAEWDTAAAQAVLEGAGGAILEWHGGGRLTYGKPGRRNSSLIGFRAPYSFGDFDLRLDTDFT